MTTTHPTTYPAYTAYAAHRDLATATRNAAATTGALIRTLENLRDQAAAEGIYGHPTEHTTRQALKLAQVCEELLEDHAARSRYAADKLNKAQR